MNFIKHLYNNFKLNYILITGTSRILDVENGNIIRNFSKIRKRYYKSKDPIQFRFDYYYSLKCFLGFWKFQNIFLFSRLEGMVGWNYGLSKDLIIYNNNVSKLEIIKLLEFYYSQDDKEEFNFLKDFFNVSQEELIECLI